MIADARIEAPPASLARQKKRGFTLTEIAIVLGIIGLILGAIWVAASAVYNNLRVSHANTAILQLTQAVRGLYATSPDTSLMTEAILISAKAYPADLLNSTGTGFNDPWSQGVTTVAPSTEGPPSLGFTISMSYVPADACTNLLTSVAGLNHDSGLFVVMVNGTAVAGIGGTGATTAGAAITAPVTFALATNACGVNNNGAQANAVTTVLFGYNVKS